MTVCTSPSQTSYSDSTITPKSTKLHEKWIILLGYETNYEYQLHNRVENLADVSTRCCGLLQGEDVLKKKTRASGRNVGKVFNPVVKLVLENQPFLMPEPVENSSLQIMNKLNYKANYYTKLAETCPNLLSQGVQRFKGGDLSTTNGLHFLVS